VSGRVLEFRSRQDWPRYLADARGERRWIESLDDCELARLAAELHAVGKAVEGYRRPGTPAVDKFFPPRKDAA
jgi:hypothetical protein